MVPGAIQLTPGGEAIVLGPDGGLTGGYPVVAVVASVDLDRVSLLALGDEVDFRAIDVEQAATARLAAVTGLRRALAHPADLR
jgi:allophanate hydrolase subunit 2